MLFQSHRLIELRQKLWTRVESRCSPSSASKEEYRNIEDKVQIGIVWGVNALLDKQTRKKWTVIFTWRLGSLGKSTLWRWTRSQVRSPTVPATLPCPKNCTDSVVVDTSFTLVYISQCQQMHSCFYLGAQKGFKAAGLQPWATVQESEEAAVLAERSGRVLFLWQNNLTCLWFWLSWKLILRNTQE